ncbi:MAG: molybdopterin-dependent oxidoreductase [Bradymonadaceae bacterium]|nr:molybdopterin-dependent oxidoreductase [Lujinxingiaceae bacterium]
MSERTRREFLRQLGLGAVGFLGIRIMSGCEFVSVEQKGGLTGTEPFLTPADDGIWYWQSGQGLSKEASPRLTPESWRLRITQGNDTLGEFDHAALKALESEGKAVSYWKTMRCVFSLNVGPPLLTLVANGIFKGIPLADLFEGLDLPADGVKIRTFGADGFTSNLALSRVLEPAAEALPAIIAYELNGEPMTRLRGGPARLIIPEMWGYKNVKWIDRLDLTRDGAAFGQYETVLFPGNALIDNPGTVALGSTITSPRTARAEVAGPDVTISGIAVVGDDRIDRVEVSLDDGDFVAAELIGDEPGAVRVDLSPALQTAMNDTLQANQSWPLPNVWVTWAIVFEGLAAGSHSVTIRASDSQGRKQSSQSSNILLVGNEVRMEFVVT